MCKDTVYIDITDEWLKHVDKTKKKCKRSKICNKR